MPEATLDDIDQEVAVQYSARDADATLRIYPKLSAMIDAMKLREVYAMDMAIVPMVERMQSTGMLADVPHFHSLGKWLSVQMASKIDELEALTGSRINPGSAPQTAGLLFGVCGLKTTKLTKSGAQESTNDKVLETLRGDHPAVPIILDYREMAKLRDSFCVVLPRMVSRDGRIRCSIRITRVASGRLAATRPNLLAIPVRSELGKRIREGFVAPAGCVLGSWDLDQIEMRELADQSGDERLCKLFIDGEDVHRNTGGWIFGKKPADVTSIERYAAKRIGFGVITGITARGLVDQMALAGAKGWTEDHCEEAINAWFGIYPGAKSYVEACRAEVRRYGYVRDRWGRIRYLPGVHSDIPRVREEALRQSSSHKISASAQGVIKRAMAVIWGEMRMVWKNMPEYRLEPLLQIHDSLLFEVTDDPEFKSWWSDTVEHLMTQTTTLKVPIRVKGGYASNWGKLE